MGFVHDASNLGVQRSARAVFGVIPVLHRAPADAYRSTPSIMSSPEVHKSRDEVLHLTGVAVIQFQRLEHCLTACMACLWQKKSEEMMARIISADLDCRGETIGQLLSALRKHVDVPANLDQRLSGFVDNRNKLIHRLFLHQARFGGEPSKDDLESMHKFISDVIDEAVQLRRIFLGFFLVIGKTLAARDGANIDRDLLDFLAPHEREFYSAFEVP